MFSRTFWNNISNLNFQGWCFPWFTFASPNLISEHFLSYCTFLQRRQYSIFNTELTKSLRVHSHMAMYLILKITVESGVNGVIYTLSLSSWWGKWSSGYFPKPPGYDCAPINSYSKSQFSTIPLLLFTSSLICSWSCILYVHQPFIWNLTCLKSVLLCLKSCYYNMI